MGQSTHKMNPVDVARVGDHGMPRGEGDAVAGLGDNVQAAMAAVMPPAGLAELHRKQADSGSGS